MSFKACPKNDEVVASGTVPKTTKGGILNLKSGIKTLAMWLIIGIIFVVLLTSILDNDSNKLAYSELVQKIEAGEVSEIELSSDGSTAEVKLKNDNFTKQVNIPSIDNLMDNLQASMTAGSINVTEQSESI